jgi:hypothetical protein
VRASVQAEKSGFPAVGLVCEGFVLQGSSTAAGLGMPNLALAAYPGPVKLHSLGEIQENVARVLVDQVIRGLMVQPAIVKPPAEPEPGAIIFKGTFEEVNRHFYEQGWSDGLPIVPPTIEKINQFLKFTDRSSSEVIGVLLPDKREATIWSIAANGVMAGCRPEYMPVLVAIVEAMADPRFGQEHIGHTVGTEILISINGPIIKELGFNYEQGALRVGFQANTSVGRFWRLFLRNVAGFLPHRTDKATFGGTWRVVLAENEDAAAKIGWQPMSVDQGFQAGDNVITISSCTSTDSTYSVGAATAEEIMDKLSARIVDIELHCYAISSPVSGVRPQVLLSPCVAEAIAKTYSKSRMRQYLYDHAVFPWKRFLQLFPDGGLNRSKSESNKFVDPEQTVHIVNSPDDFLITISGDPGRDNCFTGAQNGMIGYPVSKKIQLPADWKKLLEQSRT